MGRFCISLLKDAKRIPRLLAGLKPAHTHLIRSGMRLSRMYPSPPVNQSPLLRTSLLSEGRGEKCTHLQHFDGTFFLMMNFRKPTWECPVCRGPVNYDTLRLNGLFVNILKEAPANAVDVEFHLADSSARWTFRTHDEAVKQQDVAGGEEKRAAKRRRSEQVAHPSGAGAGAGAGFVTGHPVSPPFPARWYFCRKTFSGYIWSRFALALARACERVRVRVCGAYSIFLRSARL
jgi:hypothetical protein